MAEVDRLVDALGIFLTGGATNASPSASLGGLLSAARVRGLGAICGRPPGVATVPIPAIHILNVWPACTEGTASLDVDSSGNLVFTPAGGLAGAAVAIAEGESKVVAGSDRNQAIRVYREAGLSYRQATGAFRMVEVVEGALSHNNVSDASRTAGRTTYRALMFTAPGSRKVTKIKLWMPPVGGSQAVYSLALEVPSSNTIQTIANETTAPTGRIWHTPTTEAAALSVPTILPGGSMGLWIRRVFPPAGTVNPLEKFQLAIKYRGF